MLSVGKRAPGLNYIQLATYTRDWLYRSPSPFSPSVQESVNLLIVVSEKRER